MDHDEDSQDSWEQENEDYHGRYICPHCENEYDYCECIFCECESCSA